MMYDVGNSPEERNRSTSPLVYLATLQRSCSFQLSDQGSLAKKLTFVQLGISHRMCVLLIP